MYFSPAGRGSQGGGDPGCEREVACVSVHQTRVQRHGMQIPAAATNPVAVHAGNGDSAVAFTFEAVQTVTRLDVEQRREEAMAIFAPIRESLQPKHAKLFFTEVVQTNPSNAQQVKGKCFNCFATVSSTGGGRFCVHLASCPLAPAEVRKAFKALGAEKDKKSAAKREVVVLATEEAALPGSELRT